MRFSKVFRPILLLYLGSLLSFSTLASADDSMMSMADAAISPLMKPSPQMRSVTYRVNGTEKTRYFEFEKSSEGAKSVVETSAPDQPTTTIPQPQNAQWIMSAFGFERNPSPPLEVQTIIGPDNAVYTAKKNTASKTSANGPNGEEIVRIDSWMKSDTGWSRMSTAPVAGATPTAEDAEKAWKAGPEPVKKTGGKKTTAAAAAAPAAEASSMDGMAMSSPASGSATAPKTAAPQHPIDKSRAAKMEASNNKQRAERMKQEQMRKKRALEQKRKNAQKP